MAEAQAPAVAATSLKLLASAAMGAVDASCAGRPDRAPCDGGGKCTTGDYCIRGACVAGPPTVSA